uniref:Outer envelope membrane protein 7 n=1 Tax=Rhizophora mucronata TaxID=61149 RepID=A0A2P2QEI2_RHIMU
MAALTTALIAIAGVVLGWITIEIACQPCLEKGRKAIDRSLNPDYDPDDDAAAADIHAPLNPVPPPPPQPHPSHSPSSYPDDSSSVPSKII